MCRGSLYSTRSCKIEDSSVDTLLTLNEVRLAYIEFQRLDFSALSEMSIISVVTMDAVITDSANSFGSTIERLVEEEQRNIDGVLGIDIIDNSDGKKVAEQMLSKAETVQHMLVERFRSFLPAAALQILEHLKNCSTAATCAGGCSFLERVTISQKCNSLRSRNRQYTSSFTYSESEHLCIDLMSETFPSFICYWIEAVRDCSTVHSLSFKSVGKSFAEDDVLSFQYESDGDQSSSPSVSLARPHYTSVLFYCFLNNISICVHLAFILLERSITIEPCITQTRAFLHIKKLQNQFSN